MSYPKYDTKKVKSWLKAITEINEWEGWMALLFNLTTNIIF